MKDNFLEYIFPGKSEAMNRLRSQISEINNQYKLYRNVPTILLLGETGVGKTFTAQAIAAHSAWWYVIVIMKKAKKYVLSLQERQPNMNKAFIRGDICEKNMTFQKQNLIRM